MSVVNVISVSGGKDSTAMILLAIEKRAENCIFVFADTGNEHAQTYEYLSYLENRLNITIERVKADFSSQIAHKRNVVNEKWRSEGVSEEIIDSALKALQPSGNPFLDLRLWKGRFPSTRRRFCSSELKHMPIDAMQQDLLAKYDEVISWQGVRRDESLQRANLLEEEDHPTAQGLVWYRPILNWTADDVFAFHDKHGVEPNPLYKQGMGRVGCMPCIHCGKAEMREIAARFPEEINRIREWEQLVSRAAKRQCSTFMDARTANRHMGKEKITAETVSSVTPETHGIDTYISWAKTSRGGKQWDLIAAIQSEEPAQCQSLYGLCE